VCIRVYWGVVCVYFKMYMYDTLSRYLCLDVQVQLQEVAKAGAELPVNSWRVSKDSTLIMFLLWIFLSLVLLLPRRAPAPFPMRNQIKGKGDGRKTESVLRGWWECSLAAISQTTIHMHGHHEATMGLAGVSLGRELRALALSHTASVRRGTALRTRSQTRVQTAPSHSK